MTKSGSPSAATASSSTSRDHVARAATRQAATGMAWSCRTDLAMPLSMQMAELRARRRRRRGRRAPRGGPGSRRPRRRGRAARGTRRRPAGRPAPRSGSSRVGEVVEEVVGRGERVVRLPRRRRGPARASTQRLSWVRPTTVTTSRRPAPSARSGAPRRTTPRARPKGPRRPPPAPGVQASTEAIHSPAEDDACASRHLSSRRISAAALIGPDVTVDGASIDSRTIAAGQLFVPIVAERDGHAFIAAALAAGAPAYLTTAGAGGGDGHRRWTTPRPR